MLLFLASVDRRSEDVGIETVVVAELKFRDVQRQIFFADFVERADHAALEDRPEALNRVGVNGTDNILLAMMVDRLPGIFGQAVIDRAFIGRQQTDFVGNHFADERLSVDAVDVIEYPRDHVALALYGTDDRDFAGSFTARHAVVTLIPVAIFVFSTDVSFVNLNDAAKLLYVFFTSAKRILWAIIHAVLTEPKPM